MNTQAHDFFMSMTKSAPVIITVKTLFVGEVIEAARYANEDEIEKTKLKTWFQLYIEHLHSLDDRPAASVAISEVCKEILKEIDNLTSYDDPKFVKGVVESVINKLGIEL